MTISSRKGIYSDSLNSKVVNMHLKDESLILLPWRWVLVVQPRTVLQQHLFFFLILKSKELQNCL